VKTATCAAGNSVPGQGRGCGSQGLAGFTLLELLVVLVIASLAIGLVTPALQRMIPAAELRSESRELLAQVRYARSRAILSQQAVQVSFDEQEHGIRFSHDDLLHRLPATLSVELEPGSRDETDPADEPLEAISFYPQGYSSGGVIRLSAADGRQFEIQVDWLTARVQLHD